ncbi:hypothetical protein J2T57_003490 [Natronocella acetinitrilica]|uniref:Uncharacterized protein n=1 Tax=Natronocella acetinitrilica TaxID=414046 RepID=A0AAE3G625_9GAMM|nr:hypothetical protein [Natronocella acetinitrilica]MCP1676329.1 hypothetical protein [Natronocella acetinitrilica]
MSKTGEPLTPEEAREYEAPMRRQLWLGLAGFVALVVILIIITMEARIRASLAEPQPSATMDAGLSQVVQDMMPLPDRLRRIEVNTGDGDGGQVFYNVLLRDREGRAFYHVGFQADTIEVVRGGARDGSAVNFEVRLDVERDGTISGVYRQDRGMHAERYQALLGSLVRQTLVANQTHNVMSIPPVPEGEWSTEELRDSWRHIMD